MPNTTTPPQTAHVPTGPFYHGSPARDLQVGDSVLPPSVTGARTQLGDANIAIRLSPNPNRMSSVYVTPNILIATDYAILRGIELTGEVGRVYRVRPQGKLSTDNETSEPSRSPNAFFCSRASVLEVLTPSWIQIATTFIANNLHEHRCTYPDYVRYAVIAAVAAFPHIDHTYWPEDIRRTVIRLKDDPSERWELSRQVPNPEVASLLLFAKANPALFHVQVTIPFSPTKVSLLKALLMGSPSDSGKSYKRPAKRPTRTWEQMAEDLRKFNEATREHIAQLRLKDGLKPPPAVESSRPAFEN